ncbi:MAG: trehalose-phosphatase [Chloroflexi bacterium]|nr:trehalose-phosphatase [Chloroflexota bacterium]MYF65306.1 trehalose-phosphatase [Chloroflexota bacterium]MYK34740.1 trehalose-phosphatase [Chloroflexota bacterium]
MSGLPDLLAHRDEALALLAHRPGCIFTDIDGTLSPIIADPLAASVPDATRSALAALAKRTTVVALTGRSVADARRVLRLDTVIYSGNHGAEWWEEGAVSIEPAAEPYLERVQEVAKAVERGITTPGTLLEHKGASLSVHYRNTAEPDAARSGILDFLYAHAQGMSIREGKMVVEVRPPVELSKGEAVRSFTRRRGLASALVLGDDRTDAEAFAVVREMRDAGAIHGLSAAVATADAPTELLASADYALADTAAVGRLLTWLSGEL